MAPAAEDGTAPPALSSVGWFSPLPSLEYAADSVVPDVCPLVLEAAQVPLGAMHGVAQNDSKLATTPDGPAGVGLAGLWPTCDVPELLPHDGPSDSPAR